MQNINELRDVILNNPNVLEDAIGGYNKKEIAFIACNPHSKKDKTEPFVKWIKKQSDSVTIRKILADRLPEIKFITFKNMPKKIPIDELLRIDNNFANIKDVEFYNYLEFLARPNKNQFHYKLAKRFKDILEIPKEPYDVYDTIINKSIILEIFKIGTPMEKDLKNIEVQPDIINLTNQLKWLINNNLKMIVFVGSKSKRYRENIHTILPESKRIENLMLPHFSARENSWNTQNESLPKIKKDLNKIWNVASGN